MIAAGRAAHALARFGPTESATSQPPSMLRNLEARPEGKGRQPAITASDGREVQKGRESLAMDAAREAGKREDMEAS